MRLPAPIRDSIIEASQAINRNCDGAKELDGVGFNGYDTHFFKRKLSNPSILSDNELLEMYQRLRKYGRQLRAHGIKYENLLSIGEMV